MSKRKANAVIAPPSPTMAKAGFAALRENVQQAQRDAGDEFTDAAVRTLLDGFARTEMVPVTLARLISLLVVQDKQPTSAQRIELLTHVVPYTSLGTRAHMGRCLQALLVTGQLLVNAHAIGPRVLDLLTVLTDNVTILLQNCDESTDAVEFFAYLTLAHAHVEFTGTRGFEATEARITQLFNELDGRHLPNHHKLSQVLRQFRKADYDKRKRSVSAQLATNLPMLVLIVAACALGAYQHRWEWVVISLVFGVLYLKQSTGSASRLHTTRTFSFTPRAYYNKIVEDAIEEYYQVGVRSSPAATHLPPPVTVAAPQKSAPAAKASPAGKATPAAKTAPATTKASPKAPAASSSQPQQPASPTPAESGKKKKEKPAASSPAPASSNASPSASTVTETSDDAGFTTVVNKRKRNATPTNTTPTPAAAPASTGGGSTAAAPAGASQSPSPARVTHASLPTHTSTVSGGDSPVVAHNEVRVASPPRDISSSKASTATDEEGFTVVQQRKRKPKATATDA